MIISAKGCQDDRSKYNKSSYCQHQWSKKERLLRIKMRSVWKESDTHHAGPHQALSKRTVSDSVSVPYAVINIGRLSTIGPFKYTSCMCIHADEVELTE